MTMRRATLALTILLAGCGFFSRSKSRFFSLDTIPGAAASVRGVPVAIDAVELPPGADRRDIVVRKADHQLDVRSTDQWRASLEPMLTHTLAFDLASRLPDGMVILPGQIKPAAARSISLVVEDIGAGPENAVTLNARWVIDNVTHREQIRIDIPSLDSAAIADGMSRASAALADRMAAGI
jgi:uncharacterized lipoprotein YmbA